MLDASAYHAHARPWQTVLHPGEAILVPKGWWHYALALDPSVTVMRNFYEASTNAKDCVGLVAAQAKAVLGARGTGAEKRR